MRKVKLIWLILCIPMLLVSLSTYTNTPKSVELKRAFESGEFLKYNIHYGPVDAGMATFEVKDTLLKVKNRPQFYCKVVGESYGGWDYFFKVRDYYISYIDTSSLLPSVFSRNVQEGDYKTWESYWFNREKSKAVGKYQDTAIKVPIPKDVHDLVSMIYYMRSINFENMPIGTVMPLNVFFDKEWFACGIEYVGVETISTSIGEFKCLKMIPKLVEGRVFKGQDDMTVYVSADKNQVPIRIESKIFVGSIKVDLIEYQNLKFPLETESR